MAKWGEGDPRWIVEDRPDATNVNNWHWTEKNADIWSRKKLDELFLNLVIEEPKLGRVVIEKMEKCEGDARVNNRKAKLIFFYEWDMELHWKAKVNGKDVEVLGKVEIPNLSEEHEDVEEVDIIVSITCGGELPEAELIKEMLRTGHGAKVLRDQMGAYIKALKQEYSEGIILPQKDAKKSTVSLATKASEAVKVNKSTGSNSSASDKMQKLALGCPVITSSLQLEDNFKCTGQEFFNAMTQPEMLRIFTASEVVLKEAKKGEPFQLLNGAVSGIFGDVVPFTRIQQQWRLGSWPPGHYSEVDIQITQTREDTQVVLKQTNVPEKEVEATRQGWKKYYFDAIKRVFGFGVCLY